MNNQKLFNAGLILITLGLSIFTYSLTLTTNARYYPQDKIYFSVMFAGTPDSYGNQIRNVTIYQDVGGAWTNRGNYTYLTYDINRDIEGLVNQSTRFDVYVYLNYTLAQDTVEADVDTRLTVTVSGEFTREVADYISAGLVGVDYWVLLYRYTWDEPNTPKAYDVSLEYSVADASGLGMPTDLTEGNPNDEFFLDPQSCAEAIYNDMGITYQEALIHTSLWGGSWGHWSNKDGYFYHASYKPFHSGGALDSSFTIDLWFVPIDSTPTAQGWLVSQWVDSTHQVRVWIDTAGYVNSRISDGSVAILVQSSNKVEAYNLSHVIVTWDKDTNSGKLKMYHNNTATESATGQTGVIDCNDELYLALNDVGSYPFEGFMMYLNLYDRKMAPTEAEEIFNGSIGYIHNDTGLQNSWSFDEFSSGYYMPNEQTLHDGLGVFTESEQWDIDFISQTFADFLFPFPYEYPELYIWLFAVCGMVFTSSFAFYNIKKNGFWDRGTLFTIGFCFVLFLIFFSLFSGM